MYSFELTIHLEGLLKLEFYWNNKIENNAPKPDVNKKRAK